MLILATFAEDDIHLGWAGRLRAHPGLHLPPVLIASFLAYLVGEFANSFVLATMKIAANGRWLWTRTTARR